MKPEFELTALSPSELALLYRMVFSFVQTEGLAKMEAERNGAYYNPLLITLSNHHITLIGARVLEICHTDKVGAQALLDSIIKQKDSYNLPLLERLVRTQIEFLSRFEVPNKRQAILDYLREFKNGIQTRSDEDSRIEFYCFLKVVNRLCPELRIFEYFFDFGTGTLVDVAIDLQGFEELRAHFNTKQRDSFKYLGKLQNITITNLAQLANRLIEMKGINFIGIKKFHVLNGDSRGGHYNGIFVKRTPSDTTIIVTDGALMI